MNELLSFALVTFSAIFFVVDPLAIVPTFLAMTAGDSLHKKHLMARKAGIATTVTLLIFAFAGSLIFEIFGITLGAFKVAGGVLLFLLALDMMKATPSKVRQTKEEEQEGAAKDDIAIIPLTIPMLAGPGAIATTMVCVSNAEGKPVEQGIIVVVILITGALTWLTLRSALLVETRLGTTGLNVLTRVMGLIVASIAIQFIVTGLKELWR
ncbi:MAG: MarC family protein [Deltaproteobacteria bacterium]|nr:MarC family protein [Deltaproteobacteria bacterium]